MAMAVAAIRSEPGAPGAPGAPGSLFKIPVGSQSSGYPQGEQKISGVLDLFFYPGVGHFCVITPGHFSIDEGRDWADQVATDPDTIAECDESFQ